MSESESQPKCPKCEKSKFGAKDLCVGMDRIIKTAGAMGYMIYCKNCGHIIGVLGG